MDTYEQGEGGETQHVIRSGVRIGRFRWAAVTVGVAIIAFVITSALPRSLDIVPVGAQLPALLAVTALESAVFGLGIAFLVFGWRTVKRLFSGSAGLALGVYGSLGWLLLSPWIHDGLHLVTGHSLDAIIVLNYLFHWGMVPFVAIVMYALFRLSREAATRGKETAA